MTTLVLLPGMDGTGELFAPFVSAVGRGCQVVRYPGSTVLDYRGLENLVASELPASEPYVLLGESFSGPIAISIAASKPPMLRGLILCCSFAANPRPRLAPLRALLDWLPDRPPLAPLEWFLAGRFASPELRASLSRAVAQVSPAVLRARLTAAIEVDVCPELSKIAVPLLYLRAVEDRVVPASASEVILRNVPHAKAVDFTAPHFLLQTLPAEAADVVNAFISKSAGVPPLSGISHSTTSV
jgi:pimeloyl-ACP methyl ester carboxylesterase